MPYPAFVYRVLIASPSDLSEERDQLRQVVYYWNTDNSKPMQIATLPVMWETDSFPAVGERTQAILNEQLADCDILIGAFWMRIGSPTGVAESGTVEEIE